MTSGFGPFLDRLRSQNAGRGARAGGGQQAAFGRESTRAKVGLSACLLPACRSVAPPSGGGGGENA